MNWLEKSMENLFTISEEKNDFIKACKEFVYIGLEDNENADFNCELCNQPNIRYEYEIENIHNLNRLVVGSECINKFIDHVEENNGHLYDQNNKVVDSERLEKDKTLYLRNITIEYLNKSMYENKFKDSIINKIEEDDALTVKQIIPLKRLYEGTLNSKNDIAFAMRKTIKVSFRKNHHKSQFDKLPREDKVFMWEFLSTSQRNSIRERFNG